MARELARADQLAVAKAMLAKRASNFLDTAVVTADLTATAQAAGPWLTPVPARPRRCLILPPPYNAMANARGPCSTPASPYIMPAMDLAHLLRGEIWEARERHDAALAAYRRIAAGSPYRLMADLRRADALDESGARTAAATLLRQLMARQEANPEPAIRLGDLFRGHKEWTDAIAAYDTAVARMEAGGKPYWSVYYARGIALERAKIWDRAEADFLTAPSSAPTNPM